MARITASQWRWYSTGKWLMTSVASFVVAIPSGLQIFAWIATFWNGRVRMNTPTPPSARRPDLDALRAAAMLLGIVLHASLSFFPAMWVVADARPEPAFGILIGLLVLAQTPTPLQLLGIAVVIAAGAAAQRGGARATESITITDLPASATSKTP